MYELIHNLLVNNIHDQETPMHPPPDIETSSADYAARFAGPAGKYLLEVQDTSVESLINEFANGSLLDVGGGHGQLLSLYQKLGMDVTIHGSEVQCFSRLEQATFSMQRIVSDILALPFENQSFDIVIAVRLISHLDDWDAVLGEICRVARFAVVVDYPSKRSLNALTPLFFQFKRGFEKNTRTYTSFSRSQLKSVFEPNGFCQITEYKQFFLPMVIHRMLGGGLLPRAIEKACRSVAITRFFGSPVMLKAERNNIDRVK